MDLQVYVAGFMMLGAAMQWLISRIHEDPRTAISAVPSAIIFAIGFIVWMAMSVPGNLLLAGICFIGVVASGGTVVQGVAIWLITNEEAHGETEYQSC